MKVVQLILFLVFSSNTLLAEGSIDYSETNYSRPVREISIIATDEGFYPNNFAIFQGEKVRFFVTSTASTPSCFVLAEHDLFISANRGRVSEGTAVFNNPGRQEFYCPANKIKGSITVLRTKRKKLSRSIASQKIGPWMPKEK